MLVKSEWKLLFGAWLDGVCFSNQCSRGDGRIAFPTAASARAVH